MDTRKEIVKELHKPARRNYPRRNVKLLGLNDLLQADLVEMRPYARINKGMNYILTAINCTSKYGYALPLKNKTGGVVAEALEKILTKNHFRYLQTDAGTEWYNSKIKKILDKYNTILYSTFTEKKASICERFNRTLKTKMYRYFSLRNSDKWIDILPKILREYNSDYHRTIQMSPVNVGHHNIGLVLRNIRKNINHKVKSILYKKFNAGDKVRISKFKGVFDKSYKANWTNEIFTIESVQPTKPVTYILKDYNGSTIKGGFYHHELQKTKHGDVYLIDKVLLRRGNRLKVLWQGFDGRQTSWIDEDSVI